LRPRFEGLWRRPDFVKLWAGQTVSVFGSIVGGTALQFTAILVLGATPFEVALLAAASLVPAFLTGLVAGAWVDRLARRPILIVADLGRAVLLATIPLAWALDALHIEQLYIIALFVGVLEIFFDTAYRTYLPSLVSRDELVEGNSKLSASASVAEFGGFGIAGWLVQTLTGPVTILLDALSFVVSAAAVALIRSREERPEPRVEGASVRREILDGLRTVLHHPILRTIAVAVLMLEFFGGMYGSVVVLYMSRGLGFDPAVLTPIWAVGGVSSFVGAMLAGRVTRALGVGPTMIGCLLMSTIGALFIPLAEGATLVSAGLLIAAQLTSDPADTAYEINRVSLLQSVAPPQLLGRVNASTRFVGLGATLLGTLLGGLLGERLGLRSTLFLAAGGALLPAAWLFLSPVRRLRTAA